jgi:hypothetical protein
MFADTRVMPTTVAILVCASLGLRGLAIAAGAAGAETGSTQTTTRPEARIAVAEEFPEGDGSVWVLQKKGQTPDYIAARLAERRPGLDLVELALQAERFELAVDLLRTHIDARPGDDSETLDVIARHWRYSGPFRTPRYRPQFERLLRGIDVIRRRLNSHPRESAARIAWQLLRIDDTVAGGVPKVHVDAGARQAFILRWPGTVAAQFAEIEARLLPPVSEDALAGMEQFAREHAGTEIGARAWAQVAGVLSSGDVSILGAPTDNADPTDRYLRLHQALQALQDGSSPNEWARLVPGLGSRYWILSPRFGPRGPARFLAAYRDFLIRQLTKVQIEPVDVDALASGASQTVPRLLSAAKVDGTAAMESLFDDVEEAVPHKTEVRYLRAQFYLVSCAIVSDAPNPAMCERARTALSALAVEPSSRYARLAHSQLAAELFTEGEYALARAQYLSYVDRYPEGDWAWLAALRAGQCSERLDERGRARDEYYRAAARYAANPLARVLGLTYAARISDALGAKTQALADYRAARSAWNRDYGVSYTVSTAFLPDDSWQVTQRALDRRILQLSRPR